MARENNLNAESGENPVRISEAVHNALEGYFHQMNGHKKECKGLYNLVLSEVEAPLLRSVMYHCEGNQTKAAEMLGINRATLRKKLNTYNLS